MFAATRLLNALPRSLSVRSVRTGEALDYLALEHRVAERVAEFSDLLPASPTRVVIGVSDPIEVLVSLFATWVAGHCAVLVNPALADDEMVRVTQSVTPGLWVGDSGPRLFDRPAKTVPNSPNAALILMTSGTTGDPKGVTLSLETLETRLKLNIAEIGAQTMTRTLCPLPLFFGHGLIGNCLTPLYAGQSLHILDAPGLREFAELGALIDRHDITFLSSVPSMWRMVLRLSAPSPTTALRRVHVGSAPLTEELWRNIEEWCGTQNVFNTYGMTETANWVSGGTRPAKGADGFVGKPWGGAFRVIQNGEHKTKGRGEVALLSPSMMLGLWGGEVLPNPAETAFLTGDIGELDEDQTLRLIGRSKNEINRAGIKVLAEEVDMLLERHPDILEACAFAIPDDISGELVGAVVKVQDGSKLTQTNITEWCRAYARQDAIPSRIAIVNEIAKTDRGKLARQAIQREMIKKWC